MSTVQRAAFIFCVLNSDLSGYVCLKVMLCVALHFSIVTIVKSQWDWIWTARAKNEHARVHSWKSVFNGYFFLFRACHVKYLFSDSCTPLTVVVCMYSVTRVAPLVRMHWYDWLTCHVRWLTTHAMEFVFVSGGCLHSCSGQITNAPSKCFNSQYFKSLF